MALDIIIGTQWGDEGKGRIVDLLCSKADFVARFSGGDNAGHSVTVGDTLFKLHLIPSGIIHPHTVGVLGNGTVINPRTMLEEIEKLKEHDIQVTPDRLRISHAAHLITPAHLAIDAAQEAARGKEEIGTTKRGIGPAYTDKTTRSGIRMGVMLDEEAFADELKTQIEAANKTLEHIYGAELLDSQKITVEFLEYARILKPYIEDTSRLLADALESGKKVVAEGAQGTLLDLDHGSYPFVTSSNPSVAGALIGLGVGVKHTGLVLGVSKVFQTRVGAGPMPTELEDEVAWHLRGTGENPWDEYGTTTGRPRRVGWLDMVLLRYANRINGLSSLALTKLDILSGIETLKICIAYEKNGKRYEYPEFGPMGLEDYTPVYEELPGWTEDVTGARTWDDLPENAKAYVRRIEELVGVSASLISVGPEREQVVVID